MTRRDAVAAVVALVLLLVPTVLVAVWTSAAKSRLDGAERELAAQGDDAPRAAVAQAADEAYCTPELKRILRRVLQSCGLVGGGGGRGCQPVQARSVATMAGADFNALFLPLAQRAAIVEFDRDSAALDAADLQLVDRTFADQRGASWFLVVARASPEGGVDHNRELSRARAEAVLAHLRAQFHDPDLDREVGLLWLGEEFAQLDDQFCAWDRSGEPAQCEPQALNRSAFVAWIDCRL